MTGPDIKQLKENFDKFSESLDMSEIDENVEQEIVEEKENLAYAASKFGAALNAQQTKAKEIKDKARKDMNIASYWLTGAPYPQNLGKHYATAGVMRKDQKYGAGFGLINWYNGSIKAATRSSMANLFSKKQPTWKNGAVPGGTRLNPGIRTVVGNSRQADLRLINILKADIEKANQGQQSGGTQPGAIYAREYFNKDQDDMMRDLEGNHLDAWRSIGYKANTFLKYVEKFVAAADQAYNKYSEQKNVAQQTYNTARDEHSLTTRAFKAGSAAFVKEIRLGADGPVALAAGDKAAKKIIDSRRPKPADKTVDKPVLAKKAEKPVDKPAPKPPEFVPPNRFGDKIPFTEQRAPDANPETIDLYRRIARDENEDMATRKDVADRLARLAADGNPDAQVAVDDINPELFKTNVYRAVKKATKADDKVKSKPARQGGGGGRSRRKERCGKAPRGEYGSRGFRPKPKFLSKARAAKYPEAKKAFDQFYADLKEFGVKIREDYKWGNKHSYAYKKILCKLDEKSAKPKDQEQAGPVDYQLANKYNANRQRLGVPILTGDQLKADYLSKLIRGGMHMGLTHEESDQLIGGRKKKGAEPVKQKQAKPKSLSGKEALVAYEHAMKIFNAADGFTDEDEENLIMMIVEKHLSEGTIGILFNMYSRVLRQKNASDRGDLVRELYHEDLTALAKKVRVALQRQTRGSEFREGKVHASKNKVVYAGKSMDLDKLIEHISNGAIKDYKSLKYNIRKKAIMESKNHRAVQSSKIADAWILNWLKENLGN